MASSEGISEESFRQLLFDISEWYDQLPNGINMLQVLYRDHVMATDALWSASKMIDLLTMLCASGDLSPTNLGILYDTINVTGQFDFKPKFQDRFPSFQNVKEIAVSKFTWHRQKLLKLGFALTSDDVEKLDIVYNMPKLIKYRDSWSLIMDLEHKLIIQEEEEMMKAFTDNLNQLQLYVAVRALTVTEGNTIPAEILARGPEALKAFNEALEEGETEVNQGRTVFMGLERVGKTSTINSFLRKDFNPDETITDAIATTKVCTQDLHNDLNWSETAHDHPGVADIYDNAVANSKQENEKKEEATSELMSNILKGLSPKIKETEKTTVEDKPGLLSSEVAESPETKPEIKRRRKNPQARSMEAVPDNIASKVRKRIDEIKFTGATTSGWRTSGNDFIMNIWDFGGQPIYHVIQRIFVVSFAVVCIVFNLEDDLDAPAKVRDPTTGNMYQHRMTNLQFILYWIRSVYTNSRDSKLDDDQLSPPVLLMGTHLDSIKGNEEEKKNKLDKIFSKIWKALEGKPYEAMVFSTIFTIENSLPFSMSNASNIMNQILKFSKKMVRTLPFKWLLVQQEIQKLKEKHIYLPTIEVIALLDRYGVKRDTQRVLLEYLHDLGEILYYPDDEALNDIIFLDLMRIVDMSKTIITVVDPKSMERRWRKAWKKLDSGILEERLLRHLWKQFNVSDETFEFFVSLLQKFGLVCERKITKGERIFYVLSRLKPEHSLPAKDYGKRAVSIFHDFGGYLPDDLFQRGVTKFIERFQVEDSEPKLSYEHVELDIDELHHVVLDVATIKHRRMFQTTIIRRKILNRPIKEDEPSPSVCKEVLNFLNSELKIFCQNDARGVKLVLYIPCVCSPNIRDAHMHIVRKFDKDVLPCGSDGMEVTRYRRLFGDDLPQEAVTQSQPAVEVTHPQPAVTKPKGYVDDAIISTVSEEMNKSWRRFGVRLGLKWSTVNRFIADEQKQQVAVISMMMHQRNSIGRERHQLKLLCTALRQHEYMWLADKLFEGDLGDQNQSNIEQRNYFDDQDLLFICDQICEQVEPGWQRLGVRLGLKWARINQSSLNKLQADNIMEVLVKWRDGQATNQIPIMINALKQHQLAGIGKHVCERHGNIDEFGDEGNSASKVQMQTMQKDYFDDQDLLFICDQISEQVEPGWRRLGVRLGLKWAKINQLSLNKLQADNIMDVLVKWRDCQATNLIPIMINALKQHQLAGIAKCVCERYGHVDEFGDEENSASEVQMQTMPKDYFDDQDLLFICDQMCDQVESRWRRLGVCLGLKWARINQLSNNIKEADNIMEVLVKWRDGQATNQILIMINALKQEQLVGIAGSVCERHGYVDEIGDAGNSASEVQMKTMPKDYFDDQDLLFICDQMCDQVESGWRRLGVRLGLKWARINQLSNNIKEADNIMEVLVKWRDGQATNQILIMINALKQQQLVGIAGSVCERHGYVDEIGDAGNSASEFQIKTMPKGYLDDIDLVFISEMMDEDWTSFGRSLSIQQTTISEIERKFPFQIADATVETLVRWRNTQDSNVNHLMKVKTVLKEMGENHIVGKLEERFVDYHR